MKDFGRLGHGEVSSLVCLDCFVDPVDFDTSGASKSDTSSTWVECNCPRRVIF